MAETTTVSPLKRRREEEEAIAEEEPKRTKASSSSSCSSYNQILCLLEDAEEQDESDSDLTSLITTLQQEISPVEISNADNAVNTEENPTLSSCSSSSFSAYSCASKEEGDKEKVMRHLLEASDDELGIPSTDFGGSNYEMTINDTNQDYVNGSSLLNGFSDALLELEDEAANYYTLLQSELFM